MSWVNLKNISVANSTTTYDIPGNSTIYSNGIMKIKESNNSNILCDADVSNLQSLIPFGNKIDTHYIDFNGTDLTTYLGFLQPSLMNYGDANSAQLLNGNYLKT